MVAKSLTAYNKNPTSANLRDYQANKNALEEFGDFYMFIPFDIVCQDVPFGRGSCDY